MKRSDPTSLCHVRLMWLMLSAASPGHISQLHYWLTKHDKLSGVIPMFTKTSVGLACLALCLVPGAVRADARDVTALAAAYHHMDAAAVRRDIKDYMSYDAPEFVTGAGNHLTRAQAANIIGMQMKYARWFKSRTNVRQLVVRGLTADVKTQLHQEFLSAYLMPGGKRDKWVLDYWNADTWKRRGQRWWRVSSNTEAMRVTEDGKPHQRKTNATHR